MSLLRCDYVISSDHEIVLGLVCHLFPAVLPRYHREFPQGMRSFPMSSRRLQLNANTSRNKCFSTVYHENISNLKSFSHPGSVESINMTGISSFHSLPILYNKILTITPSWN